MTPGKVNECSEFKKSQIFLKIWWNPRIFYIVLYYTKRKCAPIESQYNIKIEDGREAPWNPNSLKYVFPDTFFKVWEDDS